MKFLLTLIGAAVLATGAYAATSLSDDSQPARTVSLPAVTTDASTGTTTTVDGTEDVSGPCEEAEHANDPRCAGGVATDDRSVRGSDDRAGEDHHQRGRGGDDDHADDHGDDSDRDEDHGGDDDGEDRSGPNRGRG